MSLYSQLLNLADRCETATGPDLGLQRDIFLALGFGERIVGSNWDRSHDGWHDPEGTLPAGMWGVTSSIDAAMMLLPEEWILVELRNTGPRHWYAGLTPSWCDETTTKTEMFPKTAALAIAAAALRAHAKQEIAVDGTANG
jgi:hypothetical protein